MMTYLMLMAVAGLLMTARLRLRETEFMAPGATLLFNGAVMFACALLIAHLASPAFAAPGWLPPLLKDLGVFLASLGVWLMIASAASGELARLISRRQSDEETDGRRTFKP